MEEHVLLDMIIICFISLFLFDFKFCKEILISAKNVIIIMYLPKKIMYKLNFFRFTNIRRKNDIQFSKYSIVY